MKNDKETDKKYKYNTNAKTAERIAELIGDTPSGTVAKVLGVTRQTISNCINGRYKPEVDNLEKMADYFNVSTDYILGRTDVKSPDTTIQGVCELLGLSEEALNVIVKLSKRGAGILNEFIVKHLSVILSDLMVLSDQSSVIIELNESSPSPMSDDYEKLMIDAVRYRATLTFNQVLDDYDARAYNREEYKKSKEQGLKLTMELLEKDNRELLKRLRKGDLKNGTNRKKEE